MRYAVYYAPPADHPLAIFGDRWIGRRAADASPVEDRFLLPGFDRAAMADLTRFPAHYGFHATLRAPFELADGIGESKLADHVSKVAKSAKPFDLPLKVGRLGRFLALIPAAGSEQIDQLSVSTVEGLEPVRKPLSEADRARRLRSPLTDRERELLDLYGYPYVFDRFHFHMTLTGSQSAEILDKVEPEIVTLAAEVLASPAPVLDLAVYQQPDRESAFTIHSRYPLGAEP